MTQIANKRYQKDFYEIVAIDGNEIIMLDYVFDHGDGFKGATGTRFNAVTQEEADERNDNLEDYEYLWREAVAAESTTLGLGEWLELIKEEAEGNGQLFVGHDTSYVEKIPAEFKDKYFPNAIGFECVGGGRMFDIREMDYETILRPDLIELIRKYEGGK